MYFGYPLALSLEERKSNETKVLDAPLFTVFKFPILG